MICSANQLTGFYMMGTLVDKELNEKLHKNIRVTKEKYGQNCAGFCFDKIIGDILNKIYLSLSTRNDLKRSIARVTTCASKFKTSVGLLLISKKKMLKVIVDPVKKSLFKVNK